MAQQGKGIILVLLLAAIIVVGVLFFYRTSPISTSVGNSLNSTPMVTPMPSQASAKDTSLMVSPAQISTTQGQVFSIDVKVDPKTEPVSAVDLGISFDPSYLTATSIQASSFLPVVLVPGKISTGSANITVGSNPTSPLKAPATVATIKFQAKKSGSTQITIVSDSQVAANGQSVLGSTTPGIVVIK